MIFGREPVAWIGVLVAIAIAVIQTLTGQGVISDAIAGRAIDLVNALAQLATFIVPLLAGILATRRIVTPTMDPALVSGTIVTVITPEGQPNQRVTL